MSTKSKPREIPLTPAQKRARQEIMLATRERMLASPCPYCVDPQLFESVLAAEVDAGKEAPRLLRIGPYLRYIPRMDDPDTYKKAFSFTSEVRGSYWLHIFTDKLLTERLKGFTVHLLGTETEGRFDFPPGPFMQTTIDRPIFPGGPWRFGLFFALRMTHKTSRVAVEVHWWPSHGRRVTLRGIPDEGVTPEELRVINEALKLLRAEARGAQKLTTVAVVTAMQKFGEKATQSAVAKELCVSEQAVRDWRKREGLENWEAAKARYMRVQVW